MGGTRTRFWAVPVIVAAALPATAIAGVLTLEETVGTVTLMSMAGGASSALRAPADLPAGNVLRTGTTGSARIALGHHGYVELGLESALFVEQLPFASFAPDLSTELRFLHGRARLVLAGQSDWPLRIHAGGHWIAVGSGEYFLQAPDANDAPLDVCLASGTASSSAGALQSPYCYRFTANGDAERSSLSEDRWLAMRDELRHLPLAPVVAAAPAPVAAVTAGNPAPVVVAEPSPALQAEPAPIAVAAPVAVAVSASVPVAEAVVEPAVAPAGPADPAVPAPVEVAVAAPIPAAPVEVAIAAPAAAVPAVVAPAIQPVASSAPLASAPPPAAVAAAFPQMIAAAAPGQLLPNAELPEPIDPDAMAALTADWALNVVADKNAALLNRHAERLRGAGYRIAFDRTEERGAILHRLLVTGFVTADAARNAVADLARTLGYHARPVQLSN